MTTQSNDPPPAAPNEVLEVGEPEERNAAALDAVAELARSIDALQRNLTKAQDHVDGLYAQNQSLQLAARKRLQDPLLRELVMLADNCRRTAQDWGKKNQASPADVEQALVGVAEDVGYALERQGVETFRPEPGLPYDRREARPVRRVETTDASQDSCIVEVLRPGYRIEDHVVRPADVVAWKYIGRPDEVNG